MTLDDAGVCCLPNVKGNQGIISLKSPHLLYLLGAIAVAVVLCIVFSRSDCEIVRYTSDSTERIGDRRFVIVLEDHAIFNREATRKLLLPLFSDKTTFSVAFCDGSIQRNLAKIRSSSLYSFGERNKDIANLDREPSSLYVVFPSCPPPKKHLMFVTAVVLRPAGTAEDLNSEWKEWCIEQNVPYFQTAGTDIKAVRQGIRVVNEMLVTALKRQSASDHQEYLQTHKN